MARVFIEGWESGGKDAWTVGDAYFGDAYQPYYSVVTEPLNGNTGTYALKGATTSFWRRLGRVLSSDLSTIYGAFRWKATAENAQYASSIQVITFQHGTTTIGSLMYMQASGDADYQKFIAYRGGFYDKEYLAKSSGTYDASTPVTIQFQYTPLDSGGVFKVWINGTLEIDYSGDTTLNQDHVDRIDFGVYGGGMGATSTIWVDDLILDDASVPDCNKIFGIIPTGAGNSTQLTPSTGSNYACVDEVPAVDTDFVSTNNTDDLDLYACSDLPAACTNVVSVQVEARVEKTDTPTPTTIGLALRTGSANYASAGKAVTAAWTRIMNLWETNPNTSAEWTEAQVNALEIGVKALA